MKCTVVTFFLQFLVQFYSQVLLIESFNFNFSSQYALLGLTLCDSDTSNIMYYTVILCHKLVFLVLVRLIAIRNFNREIDVSLKLKLKQKIITHC